MIKYLCFPCSNRKLAQKSLLVLKSALVKLNLNSPLDFFTQSFTLRFCEALLSSHGYLKYFLKIMDLNTSEFANQIMEKYQPAAFVTPGIGFDKIYDVIAYISRETGSQIVILYPNILAEIAWTGNTDILLKLEQTASFFITGDPDSALSIRDLYDPDEISHIYEVSLFSLITKLGMSDVKSKE